MRDYVAVGLALLALCASVGCEGTKSTPAEAPIVEASANADADPAAPRSAAAIPDSLPNGLLLAFSQYQLVDGEATSEPGPARFDILTREGGEWKTEVIEDPQSNIFHKVLPLTPRGQPPGFLTASGTDAYVKFWKRNKKGKLQSTVLWHPDFGGNFNRIRDVEVADLDGDGADEIVVATHDQGVVAILRQRPNNKWKVERIYERKDTFVHEIEIGDVDGDGVPEVYATPTPPNRLFATQAGDVLRFVPQSDEAPTTVAALGRRHAKEIYVGDVDGDGKDELYVPVEARTTGRGADLRIVEPVEIRRYDVETPSDAGIVVATIPDQHARFVTAGDVDGDGRKEMVVASFSTGLWLLRPGKDPKSEWGVENIDRDSGGYEHAARFADLDGDGIDELYVADDKQGELRRYVWVDHRPKREVIQKRDVSRSRLTWNIVEFPREPHR